MPATRLTIRRFNKNGFSITECQDNPSKPEHPTIRTFRLDTPTLNSLIDALNFVKFSEQNATIDIQT